MAKSKPIQLDGFATFAEASAELTKHGFWPAHHPDGLTIYSNGELNYQLFRSRNEAKTFCWRKHLTDDELFS